MAAIFGEGKFFENCKGYISQIPCGSKILTKSLYLARLRRQKQIRVLPFLTKIRKFKMAAIFGEGKIFLKIATSTFLRYPMGRKFRRNRSISHGLGDTSTFAFFSTQNSQLLIYLLNYSLIYEAIPPKSNPIQAINPMNLHVWKPKRYSNVAK